MFSNLPKTTRLWLIIYFLLLFLYSLVSYGLTAGNLTLINTPWFEHFQTQMWQIFFHNRPFLTTIFVVIFLLLFICFLQILKLLKSAKNISTKQQILLILFFSLPLLFSYNAFSRDVFNYIFNSRMVIEYQANPHLTNALQFAHDPWTRFMHNIHTEAPYGYNWTIISLMPYLLGLNKFVVTWFNFRLFSLLSLILISLVLTKTHRLLYGKEISFKNWALLFLNPLILLEIISNSHNDLWMMLPAIMAFNLLLKARKSKKKILYIFSSLLFLTLSITIKLATLALIPIFLIIILYVFWPKIFFFKKINLWKKYSATLMFLASILMFLPLITNRSQQFHPWYLSWPLVFIPVIKNKIWKVALIIFSITSLLRYLPWMYYNDYGPKILFQQKIITWSALILTLLYLTGVYIFQKIQNAQINKK